MLEKNKSTFARQSVLHRQITAVSLPYDRQINLSVIMEKLQLSGSLPIINSAPSVTFYARYQYSCLCVCLFFSRVDHCCLLWDYHYLVGYVLGYRFFFARLCPDYSFE